MHSVKIEMQASEKLILAISWWIDSICMLHIFLNQYDKKNLTIAHVNHNLRWDESNWDEEFVKNLALKNKIKYFKTKLKSPPKNEEEARDKRYEFLRKVLKDQKAKYIVTAQHKDDLIETLLFQLIRWTWSFCPMKQFSNDIWRPLIEFSKKEILSYSKKNKLEWRQDSTNSQNIFTRNILRNKIIPEIVNINPNFWESILRMWEISSKNSELILEQAKNILHSNNIISKITFDNLHIAHKRWILKSINPYLSFTNIEEIIKMIAKWIWKKEKHWFILENWIVKNDQINSKLKTQNSKLLILASSSPQRKRLMLNISDNFVVIPSNYEEKWDNKKNIEENIKHFAEQKALSVSRKHEHYIIIWCDTFVVHPEKWVYMKPKNEKEARMQLESYSWKRIEVLSWISVIKKSKPEADAPSLEKKHITITTNIVKSHIQFEKFSKKQIDLWISKNEWQERSWWFSVEGFASNFIKSIDWCFFNIIWLPVSELRKMLLNLI